MQSSLLARQYWLILCSSHCPAAGVFGAWLYQDRYTPFVNGLAYGVLTLSLSLILTVCTSVFLWQYPPDREPPRARVFLQMIGD